MIRTIQFPSGVGKAVGIRKHLSDLHNSGVPDKLLPEFIDFTTKAEVQNCDIRRALADFGPEADRKLLKQANGKVLYAIEGYDDVAEELIEIPEVRRYFQVLYDTWPHWLFSGSLLSPNMMAIAFATLPNVTILRQASNLCIQYNQEDMQAFLNHALPAAAWLHHRIGTGKRKGLNQLRAAAAYFGMKI